MKSERQKLIKKLDKIFSEFIRRRDSGRCYTCGRIQDWKLTDCGHYIRRGKLQFRWDEINCHCQCKKCNGWNEGEKQTYRRKLIEQFGEIKIEIMERDSNKPYHFPTSGIKTLIYYYSELLKHNSGSLC